MPFDASWSPISSSTSPFYAKLSLFKALRLSLMIFVALCPYASASPFNSSPLPFGISPSPSSTSSLFRHPLTHLRSLLKPPHWLWIHFWRLLTTLICLLTASHHHLLPLRHPSMPPGRLLTPYGSPLMPPHRPYICNCYLLTDLLSLTFARGSLCVSMVY